MVRAQANSEGGIVGGTASRTLLAAISKELGVKLLDALVQFPAPPLKGSPARCNGVQKWTPLFVLGARVVRNTLDPSAPPTA